MGWNVYGWGIGQEITGAEMSGNEKQRIWGNE